MGRFMNKATGLGILSSVLVSTAALAGGFDRGAVNIDQLFDRDRFSARAGVTYVNPQRKIKNIANPNPTLAPGAATNVDVDGDYVVPRFGAKFNLSEGVDCLATYTEPFGGDANYGTGNAYSPSTVEFYFNTKDYGLTCSYMFSAGETKYGDASLRLIAGASYMEAEGFQSRELAQAALPGALGTFTISDNTHGWRLGLAYEIPAIALNATILYNSKYELDFTGIRDTRAFGGGLLPITLTTEIPQALDIKLQTGINKTTLAFLNMRWQEWSKLGIIPVVNATTGAPTGQALEPGYGDGYTITAGIGKSITEDISTLASLTWDKGTSTFTGTQTDSWTLAGGVRFKRGPNFRLSLGGAVGILEGGSSGRNPNSIDPSNAFTYSFDADLVYALTASMKYRF